MKKDELSWWDISNHLYRGYRLDQLSEPPKTSREGIETTIVPGDARYSEYWGSMSAYIGLGSNLGDREKNLLDAIELIRHYHQVKIYERDTIDDEFIMNDPKVKKWWPSLADKLQIAKLQEERRKSGQPPLLSNLIDAEYEMKVSSFYETAPVDCQDPNKFLNAVVKIQTRLDPKFLLETLQRIEYSMGRERPYPNAPRIIDLDLLCYAGGCWVTKTDTLTLPHPRLRERAFVMIPLLEIEPDLFIRGEQTGEGGYVSELLKKVSTEGVRKWSK